MPRTLGDSFIHVSKIDAFVEVDRPMDEFRPEPSTDIEKAIGKHVASLIGDEACLQLGLGSAFPTPCWNFLGDHQDLGVHTEMFTEALPDLVDPRHRHRRKEELPPGQGGGRFHHGHPLGVRLRP